MLISILSYQGRETVGGNTVPLLSVTRGQCDLVEMAPEKTFSLEDTCQGREHRCNCNAPLRIASVQCRLTDGCTVTSSQQLLIKFYTKPMTRGHWTQTHTDKLHISTSIRLLVAGGSV